MLIAVDFDGTIVEHRFPEIGREIPFAIATLKRLQAEHHQLVLWTSREGRLLTEAVDYCRDRGLEFYAVNSPCPADPDSGDTQPSHCRKLTADLYIDDRGVGGLPDWGVIYQLIHHGWTYEQYLGQVHHLSQTRKRTLCQRIKGTQPR